MESTSGELTRFLNPDQLIDILRKIKDDNARLSETLCEIVMNVDSKVGITGNITNLMGLNNIKITRHFLGYELDHQLHEFVIFGRWILDSCGNFGRIIGDFIPKDHIPNIPDVLTKDEFWEIIKDFDKTTKPNVLSAEEIQAPDFDLSTNERPFSTSITVSLTGSDIPSENLLCPVCNQSWTIENHYDTHVVNKTEIFDLKDFIGKTLKFVKEVFAKRNDAIYRFCHEKPIRNDRFIDLTPLPEYKTLKVNERGFVGEKDGITDEYLIQKGDEGYLNIWLYYHKACFERYNNDTTQTQFRKIFEEAAIDVTKVTPTKNEYCSCENCAPWYIFETPLGKFKVGWRKRVINLAWEELIKELPVRIFSREKVTQGATYIHCWGYDAMLKYLKRIKKALDGKSKKIPKKITSKV